MSHSLLLADEDSTTLTFLTDNLAADGYAVAAAADATGAIAHLRNQPVDLVLVDVNGDTLGLVDWIRDETTTGVCALDTPIIATRSHVDELERVRLLERGADDVVAKPFSYPELRARIRAVLRRCAPRKPQPVTIAGPIRIDHHQRRVIVDERPVSVPETQYRLLCHLASDPTRVFTREELLRDVWGYPGTANTRTLDTHAHRLRQRLRARAVINVWGVGYRLIDP